MKAQTQLFDNFGLEPKECEFCKNHIPYHKEKIGAFNACDPCGEKYFRRLPKKED